MPELQDDTFARGDVARTVARLLTGSDIVRFAVSNSVMATELLESKGVWIDMLRRDYGGDPNMAAALCGVDRGPRRQYKSVARALQTFGRDYQVARGDIARPPPIHGAQPEALVVPSHPQLLDVGVGAAHAVHVVAGEGLTWYIEELLVKQPQGFDIGSTVTCPGFDTGCRAIIFVISPPRFMPVEAREELLHRCYHNAFSAVRLSGARSCAMGAIATGAGGASAADVGAVCAREALAHMAEGGAPALLCVSIVEHMMPSQSGENRSRKDLSFNLAMAPLLKLK
eukprot:CAMPEP_0194493320 /NCGR_PEP_ID=MMETSP0253-20130528/11577_1 /TAXON_ID=2966 /ORGANISM="Noctiluca scintillans" /LENGTH=283 /DNA_ID=CAMNT_0039334291 /DNA_START=44 /DNA_END=896 /DNA_ORIENTATION=-